MFGKGQKQANKTNKHLAGGVVHISRHHYFCDIIQGKFHQEHAKEEVKAGLFLLFTDRVETH